MAAPLGIAFAPTSDNAAMAGKTPGTAPQFASPVQVLNYRLPTVSPNAVSPLLSQKQVGSGISSAVLQSVLKTVFGSDDMSQILSGMPPAPGQTQQTFNAVAPQPMGPHFEGNHDTAPQQGPPQFDNGGGYTDRNPWELLTLNDDDPLRQHYMDMLRQSGWNGSFAPPPLRSGPLPAAVHSADNDPFAGSGRA